MGASMAEETKIIRIVVDSSRAIDNTNAATRAWERMEKSQASASSSLDRMEATLGRVGGYLKAQLALMVADVANRFLSMAKGALDAAANMGELADQLGITTRGLQALQFAAVQNNLKLEQLETGVSKFSQKIGEAAGGSKQMIDALNAIGVKILDTQGKLRPTEDLLQNVAAAIVAIDDPAKRAAAAVDFFGKAGTRMLPMLPAIAKGMDDMAASARRAGAMISDEAIAKLDRLSDSGAKAQLQMRAMFAENAAEPLTQILDFIVRKMENLQKIIQSVSFDLSGLLKMGVYTLNPGALVGQLLANTPAEAAAKGIKSAQDEIANIEGVMGMAATDRDRARMQTALDTARARLAGYERQAQVLSVGGKVTAPPSDPDNIGIFVPPRPGATNPTPTGGGGGGETPEQKYAKLTIKLQETARAQDLMTAAARAGDVAFAEQQVHVDAVQKSLEIFGKRLADNDPLLVELEARLLRISRGKAAEAFAVATTELEKQNVILEAQIRLMGEAPEIQAREIALIKAKNEAEKAGSALTAEDIDRRRVAIEQNETLKSQQEELRKAQELWTEPLKQALRDIQSTAADAFEQMLESGKFNFEELGKVFKRIITRMAAEFLALATIRPVMSVLVNAVSPGFARQMGLGTTGLGGGSSVGMPSIGGGSLFGGGGPGLFGGLGDWLNTPLTGPYAGMSPSSMAGVPMLSPSIMSPSTWGITPMQGLGAAAGIGMGAYQLLAGGGSTASTIGGIGSMIGGAVSLIPGVGQIAGPAIAILSSILPGLLGGDQKPTITNQGYGQVSYGANGFGTSGGAWGPNADMNSLTGPLAQVGQTMQGILNAFGGVKEAGKVWGVALESMSQGNGDWQFDGQTSFLVGPGGQKRQWGQGSTAGDIGMEAAGVAATLNSILGGAVGEISENMRQALGKVNQSGKDTFQTLGAVVAQVMAFDEAVKGFGDVLDGLGKSSSVVEQALAQIDAQFAELYATANMFGLATSQIDTARQRERLKLATDFADSIQRGINDFTDPNINKLADLDRWRTEAIATNADILKNITGSLDQINKIEELYALQRQQIVEENNDQLLKAQEQAAQAQIDNLQDLIRSLTPGGALANVDPRTQLAGLEATYKATFAQASAGNQDALGRFTSDASAYAQFGQSFYAGSTDYNRIRDTIVRDAQALQGAIGGGLPSAANQNMGAAAVNAQTGRLLAVIDQQSKQITQLMAELSRTNSLLQRYIANAA